MKNKPIIVVNGEPNSIFLEIFFKSIKRKKFKSPIILITSLKLLKFFMKKLNFKKKIKIIDLKKIDKENLNNNFINLIDINYNLKFKPKKITNLSKSFIDDCFKTAFKLVKSGISNKLVNGPISKKNFLNKKYPGMTEYFSKINGTKMFAMLIYNKELSVCPLTTHVPIKNVKKLIKKSEIKNKIDFINRFYRSLRGIKPKIAILGLNPHCESNHKYNEDDKILRPTIKSLINLGFKVSGPHSADTIFLKKNRKKYDVILGMYHDQVLTPLKTLYEYDAINITLGLDFLRVTPDHGPNINMVGKNKSNPQSLINAMTFLDIN